MYYDAAKKDGENRLDFSEAKVGMFVCGNSNRYAYTGKGMTIGLITKVDIDSIRVMIIRNASAPHKVGECYPVDSECFDVIDIKILSKKSVDCVDGSGRTKYNVPILEIINGQNLSLTLMYSDRFYDLKEPLFTY